MPVVNHFTSRALLALFALFLAAPAVHAQTPIKTGCQIAYWALPIYIATEMERPIYPLNAQLKLLSRSAGKSSADTRFEALAGYLTGVGTIQEMPDPKSYITDEYLRLVDKSPTLRQFANRTN